MIEKTEKRQDQQPKPDKKKARKFPKMTKKVLVIARVCGELALGAGGITGVAATDGYHARIEVAVKHEGLANKSDTKIDQQVAVDQFNKKYPDKHLNEVELESDKGKYVYKAKGFDNTNEHKVKVNARDGKLISNKSEKFDRDEKGYALDPGKTISRDETIVEKAAEKGNSIEQKLGQERENQAVWEVKVKDGRTIKEVKTDAGSKKVLAVGNEY